MTAAQELTLVACLAGIVTIIAMAFSDIPDWVYRVAAWSIVAGLALALWRFT